MSVLIVRLQHGVGCWRWILPTVFSISCIFAIPFTNSMSAAIHYIKNLLIEINSSRSIFCPYKHMWEEYFIFQNIHGSWKILSKRWEFPWRIRKRSAAQTETGTLPLWTNSEFCETQQPKQTLVCHLCQIGYECLFVSFWVSICLRTQERQVSPRHVYQDQRHTFMCSPFDKLLSCTNRYNPVEHWKPVLQDCFTVKS